MKLLATLPPCSLYLQGVIGELPDVELGGCLLGLGHGRVRDDDGDGVGAREGGREGGRSEEEVKACGCCAWSASSPLSHPSRGHSLTWLDVATTTVSLYAHSRATPRSQRSTPHPILLSLALPPSSLPQSSSYQLASASKCTMPMRPAPMMPTRTSFMAMRRLQDCPCCLEGVLRSGARGTKAWAVLAARARTRPKERRILLNGTTSGSTRFL